MVVKNYNCAAAHPTTRPPIKPQGPKADNCTPAIRPPTKQLSKASMNLAAVAHSDDFAAVYILTCQSARRRPSSTEVLNIQTGARC